ncbi:archaeosine biosynthesis radical SAM protein RaSEA [Candidatus Methanomassiliicoccus intestinalis]|uniref:archaeosine biosynthesis radical SAM protein RaSEA n=1 Tax=Candidatus Methanomassiliicoccus intestinalis TaxID=1406512 RepID=UPI0037DD1559
MAKLRKEDLQTPVSIWREKDMINGEKVDAFVIILRTTGCWWAHKKGCTMCGYNTVSAPVTEEDLRVQLAKALEKYANEKMVKIYTSGSFLDDHEIPSAVRKDIFTMFSAAARILFESRPEFVTAENLTSIEPARSAVAIGLESANEEILRRCIRKGFTVSDYEQAAKLLNEYHIPLRTYLLLKPPYLTEKAALEDALASVQYAAQFSESVSVNPVNVQRNTLVESLWTKGNYAPPMIWTLIEVLKAGSGKAECRLLSSPSGGGAARGVHNCGQCDKKLLSAIEKFSYSQDPSEFAGLECECQHEWKALLELQDLMFTGVDVKRQATENIIE